MNGTIRDYSKALADSGAVFMWQKGEDWPEGCLFVADNALEALKDVWLCHQKGNVWCASFDRDDPQTALCFLYEIGRAHV